MENQSNGLDFNSFSMKKKAILITAGVGLISCFLPAISFSMYGISNSSSIVSAGGEGYILLLGFIGVIAVTLFYDKMKLEEAKANKITKFTMVGVAAIWLIVIIRMMNAGNSLAALGAKAPSIFSMLGIGFYLITIVLIAILLIYFDVIKLEKGENE